ncbi:hypothetical protein [Azospirillum largimobile]
MPAIIRHAIWLYLNLESSPGRTSCGRIHEMVRYGRDERTKTLKTP